MTRNDIDPALSARLREALLQKGKTAYWLSRELQDAGLQGCSSASMSRYLRGMATPSIPLVREIARRLEVPEPWLFCGDAGVGGEDSGLPGRDDLRLAAELVNAIAHTVTRVVVTRSGAP